MSKSKNATINNILLNKDSNFDILSLFNSKDPIYTSIPIDTYTSLNKNNLINLNKTFNNTRRKFTTSVVDGKIYCIGGYTGSIYQQTNEMYDPAANTWTTKTNMTTGREALTSSVVDGKIYCIGGYNGSALQTNEMYDPITNTWTTKANMTTARQYLTATVVNGKIYCIGGKTSGGTALANNEMYDPITNTWTTKTVMTTARDGLTSATSNGVIYCIGGYNSTYRALVEAYDVANNTWSSKTSCLNARAYTSCFIKDDLIYLIGGMSSSTVFVNKVEVYSITSNVWLESSQSVINDVYCLSPELINNKIYLYDYYNSYFAHNIFSYIPFKFLLTTLNVGEKFSCNNKYIFNNILYSANTEITAKDSGYVFLIDYSTTNASDIIFYKIGGK
jgi:N-acetylneuraminic acid mutarotase